MKRTEIIKKSAQVFNECMADVKNGGQAEYVETFTEKLKIKLGLKEKPKKESTAVIINESKSKNKGSFKEQVFICQSCDKHSTNEDDFETDINSDIDVNEMTCEQCYNDMDN